MSALKGYIVKAGVRRRLGQFDVAVRHGPQLAAGEPAAERDSFREVVLMGRLRETIRRLNPAIAEEPRDGLQARIGIAEPGDADRARILQMLGLPGLSAFVPSVCFVGPSALLR